MGRCRAGSLHIRAKTGARAVCKAAGAVYRDDESNSSWYPHSTLDLVRLHGGSDSIESEREASVKQLLMRAGPVLTPERESCSVERGSAVLTPSVDPTLKFK